MTTEINLKRIHTTFGELVAAIMDVAVRITNARYAYKLRALLVNQMLQPVPVPVVVTDRTKKFRCRY